MSVASFIASQRTEHGVPHALACRVMQVSESWFYKWRDRPPTAAQQRRTDLDAEVKVIFEWSAGEPHTYGSPRVHAELRDRGWKVTKKTVAASMARQGLFARPPKRPRRCTTRQDSKAPPAPDLLQRRFGADGLNQKWCGDLTEIPTDEGKLYLAIVEDLCSRRVPGFALDEHHDAELATGAVTMAAAARGGDVAGVIFHSDRGSEYTSRLFAGVCERLHITQSMGRVGSALDNAPAESFFSTLEWECLRRRRLASKAQARRVIADWIDRYNRTRRHSSIGMMSPVDYELALATAQQGEAA